MTCLAREYARFYAAHDGSPSHHLRQFMAARCGAPMTHASIRFMHGDTSEDEDAEGVAARWDADLRPWIDALQGNRAAGGWVHVADGKAVAVLASRVREAYVEPAVRADDGTVRLKGELFVPAESIRAFVNRGRFDVQECTVDASVRLPAFDVECVSDPEDPLAYLSLTAFPSGRILGDRVLHTAVWSGDGSDSYRRPARTEASEVTGEQALGEAFVEGVNAIREQAGRPPLRFDTGQSLVATDLAAHYFEAGWGDGEAIDQDRIALGMMAGWSVEGDVSRGRMSSALSFGTRDVAQVLDYIADNPWDRFVLLDPKATRVAVGPVFWEDAKAMGTLVGVYQTITDTKEASIAARGAVRKQIAAAREAKGKKQPKRLAKLENRATPILARLASGEYDPDDAWEAWGREGRRYFKKGSRGYILHIKDPADFEVPKELLDGGIRKMAIAVGRHRAEDEPWYSYVVMVIYK